MKKLLLGIIAIGLGAHFTTSFACQSPVGYWKSIQDKNGPSELTFYPDSTGAFKYNENGPRSESFSWKIISLQKRTVTSPSEYPTETNVIELTYYQAGKISKVTAVEYLLCGGNQIVGLDNSGGAYIYRYKRVPRP